MENVFGIFNSLSTAAGAMDSMAAGVASVISALIALVGLLYCFFGFKLMKLWFAVCGFFLGASIGFVLTSYAFHIEEIGPHIFAALMGGVIGAILLYRVYLLGIFLMNLTLSFLLFVILLGSQNASLIVSGICAIFFGILAVKFARIWTILSTGIAGGLLGGSALASLVGITLPGLQLLIGSIVAALGVFFQLKTTRKVKSPAASPTPSVIPNATPETANCDSATSENIVEQPANNAFSALISKTIVQLKTLWADRQKRIFLCVGAGVGIVLLLFAITSFTSQNTTLPTAPESQHTKTGYKAADGKDIAQSAFWLDAESIDFYDTDFTPVSYHAGDETAALIAKWDDYDRNYGLINKNGIVVATGYNKLKYGGTVNGEPWFAGVSNDYSFSGFLNARGECVLDLSRYAISTYSFDVEFGDNLCIVQQEITGLYGIIDTSGNFVVPFSLNYDWIVAPTFSEGYAMAQLDSGTLNSRCGLIDSRGQEVIPCEYDSISDVQDGILIAGKDRKYGALYTDGSIALPFIYSNYNEAAVKLGWINAKDIPPAKLKDRYQYVEALGNGLFVVGIADDKDLGYYPAGIVNHAGKVVLKPEYQSIQACDFEPGLFQVWNGSTTFYCDWKGERRTPDFSGSAIYGATPIFQSDGKLGVLPKLLTTKEQEAFLD